MNKCYIDIENVLIIRQLCTKVHPTCIEDTFTINVSQLVRQTGRDQAACLYSFSGQSKAPN